MIRKLILISAFVAFVVSACSACAQWNSGNRPTWAVSHTEARDSVYKIHVTQEIDTSGLDPMWGFEKVTSVGSMGTGWVQGGARSNSHLMTAGHLCETADTIDGGMLGMLPVIKTAYQAEHRDGTIVEGGVVILDDDTVDLCMITFPGDLGLPLAIANDDPEYGSRINYIGAPKGHWGGNVALIFEGLFSGRGNPFGTSETYLTLTISGAPGASGSPVLKDGKVIGVLVAGARNFWDLILAVPHDQVKDFIKRAERR
jgi:S1-C subfamily serine protease